MAGDKSEEFALDDSFAEEAPVAEAEAETSKTSSVKNSLTKRRVIDDLLEERKLQRRLRDYDYDLDRDE